jgi:NAD(P)-dependent dehydrogenase (short-subunit alcohol dehydrogenase family)
MAITPQVALVTGASWGIRRGIAIDLARLGFSIAINYARSQQAALGCKGLCAEAAPPRAESFLKIFQADILKGGETCRSRQIHLRDQPMSRLSRKDAPSLFMKTRVLPVGEVFRKLGMQKNFKKSAAEKRAA